MNSLQSLLCVQNATPFTSVMTVYLRMEINLKVESALIMSFLETKEMYVGKF